MITKIKGRLTGRLKDGIELETSCGLSYYVVLPPLLCENLSVGETKEFFTYHYVQNEPSRAIEFLIGFLSPVEREFFELFITVSGIGPKAAAKAFNLPVSEIAKAIYEGDEKTLTSMPGIGKQKAKQIIARLQDKVSKFVLLKEAAEVRASEERDESVFEEAFEILLQLQYKKNEAKRLLEKAKNTGKEFSSAEEVLEEIYKKISKI